jgi:hypothetical protein
VALPQAITLRPFGAVREFLNSFLARLYPFLECHNADGISLLFSTPDFLNVSQKDDIQKVWPIVGTLSLLLTFLVSKMDKVELRLQTPKTYFECPNQRRLSKLNGLACFALIRRANERCAVSHG